MDINKQKRLTSGKGWKQVIVDHAVGEDKKAKAKAKRIWGGIKATPAVVKKTEPKLGFEDTKAYKQKLKMKKFFKKDK